MGTGILLMAICGLFKPGHGGAIHTYRIGLFFCNKSFNLDYFFILTPTRSDQISNDETLKHVMVSIRYRVFENFSESGSIQGGYGTTGKIS